MQNTFFTWIASVAAILMLSLFAAPAMADALDQYRKSGAIIERHDGLVEASGSASAEAKALVQSINAKRRKLYMDRAKQQGVPASEVAKIYANEIYASAPSGTKFRQPNGSIVQK